MVGTFPDGRSALMPATARLKYIAECEWGASAAIWTYRFSRTRGGGRLAGVGLEPDRWQHRGSAIFAKDS